jgi:hypothetical protein
MNAKLSIITCITSAVMLGAVLSLRGDTWILIAGYTIGAIHATAVTYVVWRQGRETEEG